jgi:hypothetical protein
MYGHRRRGLSVSATFGAARRARSTSTTAIRSTCAHRWPPHDPYLFGLSGPALTVNALGATGNRTMPAAIVQYLDDTGRA